MSELLQVFTSLRESSSTARRKSFAAASAVLSASSLTESQATVIRVILTKLSKTKNAWPAHGLAPTLLVLLLMQT
jgi:hypothetical protein